MRAIAVGLILFLLSGCGGGASSNDAPRDLGAGLEGLQFPDVPARFDQTRDAPAPVAEAAVDRSGERPRDLSADRALADLAPPDTFGPDLGKPDLWKGGPCFYDWTSWTCQTSSSSCTAGCGIATITCVYSSFFTICSCTVNGNQKSCGIMSGSGCSRCQNAFKSGCCVPP
jgi:hypothetical protein